MAGVKGFRANVDLQPVFDHYKCVTYVCSYFTKDETECSQAIMTAAKESKAGNLSIREGLRKIGAVFLSGREVSSQEFVFRCMPELWLRKIFPKLYLLIQIYQKELEEKESFVISLSNIRSLVKHSIDLRFDRNINDSDLILLPETQLLCHTDDEEIRNSLSTYTLHRQDHDSDKFTVVYLFVHKKILKLKNMSILQL